MASSSSSSSCFMYGKRLLWVKHPSNTNNWWPALLFQNYGEALRILSPNLNTSQKTHLTLKFLNNTTTQVLHLVATDTFLNFTPSEMETLEFFKHVGQCYSTPDLEQPMQVIQNYLAMDLAKEKADENDKERQEPTTNTSWEQMWTQLQELGWKRKNTKSGKTCFVFPGCTRTNGVLGVDYFNTLEELQEYCKKKHGWNEQQDDDESDVVVSKKTSAPAFKNNKRRRSQQQDEDGWNEQQDDDESDVVVSKKKSAPVASKNNKRRRSQQNQDEGRIWGRPKKQQHITTAVPSTPLNQATQPQDPAKPRLDDSDDDDEEEDAYNWKVLWAKLKSQGWIAVRATKYNPLDDWYYVRPHRSVEHGEMGKDYFANPNDVILFCRSQDEQGGGGKSPLILMPSPRKRSRKSRAPPPAQQDEAIVVDTTSTALTKPTVPKNKRKQEKDWWFHDDALPSFRDVWSILQHKLHFRYSNGCYKLPFGDEVFATDLDMRMYLVKHGIPHFDHASKEEATTLLRWVTFVNVPVKDTNSTIKLDGMQELTNQEASYILTNQLGFRKAKNGSFTRGESESFGSLQQVRNYFRAAESLAPPVQGRRRGKHNQVDMSNDQVLEFRLWAALSPTPLPTFPSSQQDKRGDGDEEEEEASEMAPTKDADTRKTQQDSLVVNDKEKDESVEIGVLKKNKASNNNDDDKWREDEQHDEFEYDEYEEKVGPAYRSIRISLSPSSARPLMTQPEE